MTYHANANERGPKYTNIRGVSTRQDSEDLHSSVCDVVDLLWDLLGAEPSFIPMKVAQWRMKQVTVDFRVWEHRYCARSVDSENPRLRSSVSGKQAELPLGFFRQFPWWVNCTSRIIFFSVVVNCTSRILFALMFRLWGIWGWLVSHYLLCGLICMFSGFDKLFVYVYLGFHYFVIG